MITTTDVANILTLDCMSFGINVFQKGNIPQGEIKAERITIHTKSQSTGTYWNKGFVEVNFCVPDINNEANLVRLQELEHLAVEKLDSVGECDNTFYRYSVQSHGIENDKSL